MREAKGGVRYKANKAKGEARIKAQERQANMFRFQAEHYAQSEPDYSTFCVDLYRRALAKARNIRHMRRRHGLEA